MFVGWRALGSPLQLPAVTLIHKEKALEGASGALHALPGPVPSSCHCVLSKAPGLEH